MSTRAEQVQVSLGWRGPKTQTLRAATHSSLAPSPLPRAFCYPRCGLPRVQPRRHQLLAPAGPAQVGADGVPGRRPEREPRCAPAAAAAAATAAAAPATARSGAGAAAGAPWLQGGTQAAQLLPLACHYLGQVQFPPAHPRRQRQAPGPRVVASTQHHHLARRRLAGQCRRQLAVKPPAARGDVGHAAAPRRPPPLAAARRPRCCSRSCCRWRRMAALVSPAAAAAGRRLCSRLLAAAAAPGPGLRQAPSFCQCFVAGRGGCERVGEQRARLLRLQRPPGCRVDNVDMASRGSEAQLHRQARTRLAGARLRSGARWRGRRRGGRRRSRAPAVPPSAGRSVSFGC